MTDDLITDLSKVSGLLVISRNSVFAVKDQTGDARTIASDLGVRYILDGSVRRSGETVRINVQLIDGTSGDNLWAERYEREFSDIFAIQDDVISSIVDTLSVKLTRAEQIDVAHLPTDNLEAYDYYLRGERLAYRADSSSVEEALLLYQRAINLDPDFAEAFAGYARVAVDVLGYNFANSLPSAVARKRAYSAASRAIKLNPRLGRSYSVLALLQMLDGEHATSLETAQQAVSVTPNSAEAYLNLAVVQIYSGRHEEALETFAKVIQLNPKPPAYVHEYRALALYLGGRHDEALTALEQVTTPTKSDLHLELLAAANAQLGRIDKAKTVVDQMLTIWPGDNVNWYRLIYAHHAREVDLAARLEGLRLASLPERPFGFDGDPALRLDSAEILALTEGVTRPHGWYRSLV